MEQQLIWQLHWRCYHYGQEQQKCSLPKYILIEGTKYRKNSEIRSPTYNLTCIHMTNVNTIENACKMILKCLGSYKPPQLLLFLRLDKGGSLAGANELPKLQNLFYSKYPLIIGFLAAIAKQHPMYLFLVSNGQLKYNAKSMGVFVNSSLLPNIAT